MWGYLHAADHPLACYFIQWTSQRAEHRANFDFLVGTWGNNSVHDKRLLAWEFHPRGPSFMAVDASERPAAKSPLCVAALSRAELVADSALMDLSTELLDSVWLGDPRIQELRAFADDA